MAGLFSSRVVFHDGFVLVSGDNCLVWNITVETAYTSSEFSANHTLFLIQQYTIYAQNYVLSSLLYSRSCYIGKLETDPERGSCGYYPISTINWTTAAAPCPLSNHTYCAGKENGSITLHAALDSWKDLGLNTKEEDRIVYHKTLTCSPLNSTGHRSKCINETESWGSECSASFFEEFFKSPQIVNYTSATDPIMNAWDVPYFLGTVGYTPLYPGGDFVPSESLLNLINPDEDFELMILQNSAMYNGPVEDPWFLADEEVKDEHGNVQGYVSANGLSYLACTEQFQICNARDECSPATGFYGIPDSYALPIFNEIQRSMIGMLYSNDNNVGVIIGLLGSAGPKLRALDYTLAGTDSVALPSNQWEIEVAYWWVIVLAQLQLLLVQQATGPSDNDFLQYMVKPNEFQGSLLCGLQKVHRSDYNSFSFLGIALILVFGSVIIVIEPFLPRLVARVRRGHLADEERHLDWVKNTFLQLQRLAYQGNGEGTWTGEAEVVPTTLNGEKLPRVHTMNSFSMPKSPTATLTNKSSFPPTKTADMTENENLAVLKTNNSGSPPTSSTAALTNLMPGEVYTDYSCFQTTKTADTNESGNLTGVETNSSDSPLSPTSPGASSTATVTNERDEKSPP